jgi:glyoxylase-like metal-dependent hydrolase (beta-lactamase superfamily II)
VKEVSISVMNHVFKDFTLHTIDGHISTIYLAVYSDKILILDCGCRCDIKRVETYIEKKLKRDLSSVKLVVASHAHPDHGGGSPFFSKKHRIPLATPRHINEWYRGVMGFIQHNIDISLGYHVARTTGKPVSNIFYKRKIAIDHPLDHGSVLPGFEDWVVYDAPGHTHHDMVFYNKKEKLLYAADVILCVNGKFLLPFPVPMEHKMNASLDLISSMDVEKLILAHGGVKYVKGLKAITDELKIQLTKALPPILEKLRLLALFSPEIRKEMKKEMNRKNAA